MMIIEIGNTLKYFVPAHPGFEIEEKNFNTMKICGAG